MIRSYIAKLSSSSWTLGLLLVWLVLEFWKSGWVADPHGIYSTLGLSRAGLESGALWQPLSYSMIHGGVGHALINGLLLLVLGSRLEWMLGSRSLIMIVLLGLLMGAGFHLALSERVLVGGSGAVFALLMFSVSVSPESRWLVPFPVYGKNLARGLWIATSALTLINPDYGLPFFSEVGEKVSQAGMEGLFGISHACHLGGALAGGIYAYWLLRSRVSLDDLRRKRARRERRSCR